MSQQSWVFPDVCTLPSAALPLRVAEFDALFGHHLERVERTGPTLLRLVLRGQAELAAQVQDLVDRESACCSFFSFTLEVQSDPSNGVLRVQLDVEVPLERAEILAALANRAEATSVQMRS